jgi:hypothetical protein
VRLNRATDVTTMTSLPPHEPPTSRLETGGYAT